LAYTSQVQPELFENITRHSPIIQAFVSPSFIETVVKCVHAASNGQNKLSFYKIVATSLRKNSFYYQFYFVGANTIFGYIIPFVFHVVINIMTLIVLCKKTGDDVTITTKVSKHIRLKESRVIERSRISQEIRSDHIQSPRACNVTLSPSGVNFINDRRTAFCL